MKIREYADPGHKSSLSGLVNCLLFKFRIIYEYYN